MNKVNWIKKKKDKGAIRHCSKIQWRSRETRLIDLADLMEFEEDKYATVLTDLPSSTKLSI